MPLYRRDGSLFGTLCALDPLPAELDEADFEIFHLLADLIAFELEADEEQHRRAEDEARRRTFVDAVAHDLKNPLQVVTARAQLLRRRLRRGGGIDPAMVETGLAGIESAVARTVDLIDEMLDAARVRAGLPLGLGTGPTDLVALVRQVVAEHQETTARHGVVFGSTLSSLVGNWDGSRLRRVVGNLVANAIRYSPEGGEVTVRLGAIEDAAGSWAELRVVDRGIGIPAADRDRLFCPFGRGGNVEGRIEGTGLGLAGARQIVEQNGGTITVESEEGVGSTFTVRLPLAGEAANEHRGLTEETVAG